MTVVWRTVDPAESRVRYGTLPGVLDREVVDLAQVTDHVVTLTGLTPGTRYYYEVGSTTQAEAGGDSEHYFVTSPAPGSTGPFTTWVVGDSGTGGADQALVRDAMLAATAGDPPDLFLHVGDIAYDDGRESEYTSNHFAPYRDILRHTVFWPSRGNHDGLQGYTNAFVLPTGGEAGGVPSGTESYYAFDYAHVHFVVLDSQGSDLTPGSPMLEWLQNDLAQNTRPWLIAFFHHPPYSKGSHDSDDPGDSGGRLIEMRENVMPILEAAGVDLVLAGHSHVYERSYLIDGVYGFGEAPAFPTPDFGTLLSLGHIVDFGSGDPDAEGPYEKSKGLNAHEGAVYVVAGHGGKSVHSEGVHPVMFISEEEYGSALLTIDGNVLTLQNLRADGVVSDVFSIVKGEASCSFNGECNDGIPCTEDACSSEGTCSNADLCTGGAACNPATGLCEVQTLVSFQEGENGYRLAQDTYLEGLDPNRIHGYDDRVEWDLDGADANGLPSYGLIRFDGIFGSAFGQIPSGSTIQSATLSLVLTAPGAEPAGDLHESLATWDEESVSWASFGAEPGVDLDVTESLQSWALDPGENLGWIFVPNAVETGQIASSEHISQANRPRLSVDFLPPACRDDRDCDDGLFCNGTERCFAGACVAGAPVDCSDGLSCTDDSCDDFAGCLNVDTCPAGEACNGVAGQCVLHAELQSGLEGYGGVEDTFLQESQPGMANGALTWIEWDADTPTGTGLDTVALLRFDDIFGTDPTRIPRGATIHTATLTLLSPSGALGGPRGDVHESAVDWDAAAATWDNFGGDPGVQPDELGDLVAPAPLTSGLAYIDVTASLQAWSVRPDENRGWIFLPRNPNRVVALSSDHPTDSARPRLLIDYSATPCESDADCDDGLFCNGRETCPAGLCVAGLPIECDDGVSCTVDFCNEPMRACDSTPDDALCDDMLFCNGQEVCDAAFGCQAGIDPCAGDGCDEAGGRCGAAVQLEEIAEGTAEDDTQVTTDAPLVAADDDLYLASISYRPSAEVTAVTGLGLAWSELGSLGLDGAGQPERGRERDREPVERGRRSRDRCRALLRRRRGGRDRGPGLGEHQRRGRRLLGRYGQRRLAPRRR
jgi:hypothetical protein